MTEQNEQQQRKQREKKNQQRSVPNTISCIYILYASRHRVSLTKYSICGEHRVQTPPTLNHLKLYGETACDTGQTTLLLAAHCEKP